MKIKHLYLIQGPYKESYTVNNVIKKSPDRKSIIGVFKENPNKDTIDLRNTFWYSGRNKLLEHAIKKYDFEYLHFLDDDLTFEFGDLDLYEDMIEKYKPLIASPLHEIGDFTYFLKEKENYKEVEYADFMDPGFNTFSKNVLEKVFPYDGEFDHLCAFLSGYFLTLKMKELKFSVFTNCAVKNVEHRPYTKGNRFSGNLTKEEYEKFNKHLNLSKKLPEYFCKNNNDKFFDSRKVIKHILKKYCN
jgi:hypothetical protein